MKKHLLPTLLAAVLLLTACGQSSTPDPALDPNLAMTQAFATVNAAFTQTALAVPTNTPLPTETPAPTPLPQPTAFVPPVILTAGVTTPVNCRFGPSTVYAGPGGLRAGKTVEAIGRDASVQWILVRELGGKKSCWVNIAGLSVQGDPASLAVAPIQMVYTPNYQPPANVRAGRVGDQVQVAWDAVSILPKDAFPESTYFIEAWVCSGGQIVYTILATMDLTINIPDQPGCAEASRGLLYTATREGYSVPATIPWPAP